MSRKSRTARQGQERPAHRTGGWAPDAICCALLLALSLTLALPRYRNGIDLGDEGFLAYGAVRVLQGQLPNRDFVSLQSPLSFYTSAAMFSLFGTSLVTLRALGLAIYLVIPLAVYGIARQRGRYVVSLAASVPAAFVGPPFFNFVPFAVWHGVAAALVAAFLAIRAASTDRAVWAVLAGLATALTLLSRQDLGVYVIAAVLSYGVLLRAIGIPEAGRRARRLLAFFATGAAIPLLLVGIGWLASGALPSVFHQLVVFPLTTYAKTSSLPMPVFQSGMTATDAVVVSMFYAPPIVYMMAAVWLVSAFIRGRAGMEEAHAAFFVVLAALFYCQALTRSDLPHLLITLGPWFVVLSWAASASTKWVVMRLGRRARPSAARLVSISVRGVPLFLGALLLRIVTPAVLPPTDVPLTVLKLPAGGVRVAAPDAAWIQNAVGVLQHFAPASRSVLVLPYVPMLYFLAERRNPTRWNYIWPGDQTPDEHRQLIAQARRDPPAVVLLMGEDRMKEYAGPVVDYVRSSFRLAGNVDDLSVYVPGGGADR